MRLKRWLAGALLVWGGVVPGFAGGPRYVTGPPFFQTSGRAIGWKQPQLLYFTDPGDLSPSVNHQAADALVAAAAGIWNLPNASITISQGGALAEHVSGQNVYLDSSGMEWPADVMAANASAVPIAVVYDADGSVTDTLLGEGASSPNACQQNGVTETVDAFDPAGYILHAILVLNGRCTGAAPEQQLQLQYQLERIFGRVLGLAWSQTNDNVFTGLPTPSYDQELHWPVMHPIDIRCGPYTYQCMVQPFVLRPDDVAAMILVYPVTGTPPAGKQVSLIDGNTVLGSVTFPTGEGMAGVNVLVQRGIAFSATPQDWYESSMVTGTYFRRAALSPFVAADTSATASEGTTQTTQQGVFFFPYMQVQGVYTNDTVMVSTEPVNPLYTGAYSLGPYAPGVVSPAGSPPVPLANGGVNIGARVTANFPIMNAPSVCGTGADGTMAAPMQEPASGWWTGTLCPFGHAAYVVAAVQPARSFAVEVTALDANGLATTTKLMPVLGVFAATDAAGSTPSLAAQPQAFNGLAIGTTFVHAAVSSTGGVRVGIADERGEGRPDFTYQARLFYADSITPALIPSAGADVTLTGTGFRAGNQVQVNGVAATVKSWSANTIVFTAPALTVADATAGVAVDVTVLDSGTGAVSTMTGVLTYEAAGQQANGMLLVSSPGTPAAVGVLDTGLFAVRVVASDGVTPVANSTVTFSVGSGSAVLGACPAASCNVPTDANGLAQTSLTPSAAGLVNLQASDGLLQQSVSLTAQLQPLQMRLVEAPAVAEIVGQSSALPFYIQETARGGGWLPNDLITFSVAPGSAGTAVFSGCNAAPCSLMTNSSGQAYLWVTPITPGAMTLVAADASGLTQQVSITAVSQPTSLKVISASSFTAYAGSQAGTSAIEVLAGDGVSTISDQLVNVTGSPGLVLGCSGTTSCSMYTDYFGKVQTSASALNPGVYTLTATSGAAVATTTYTFLAIPPSSLSIVSYPTGVIPLGTPTTVPFSVRLVDGFSRPVAGASVTLSLPAGSGVFSCAYPSCNYQTDSNGTVSDVFTPRLGGSLVLNAVAFGVPFVTVNVMVAGGTPTLSVIQAPPATVTVGSTVTAVLQLLGANGNAINLATVWVDTTQGALANPGCPFGLCKFYTDVNGKLTLSGIAWTPGQVSIVVTTDGLAQTVSFNVVANVMNFKLVSAPSGTVPSGTPATPFAVEILGADGSTPVSGQNVTFSLSQGSASLAACTSVPCVVKTGANGIASTGAIATPVPGNVNLLASLNGATISASFNVAGKPDILSLSSAPASVFQSGAGSTPFAVSVTLADGVTPATGVPVNLSGSGPGAVQFALCGTAVCAGVTDASGKVSSLVTGAVTGTVTLSATAQLPTGNQTVTSVVQVLPSLALMKIVSAPSGSVLSGNPAPALVVQVLGPDGVTPASGQVVTFTIANGSGSFPACAANPCAVATGANGMASSGSIATSTAGAVSVRAVSAGLSANAAYTVTPRPDVLAIVQAPVSGLQWVTAATPFSVKLTLADLVTPMAGVTISLSTSAGVSLGLCGNLTCTATTDSQGMVSTTVTGLSQGVATLAATVQLATGSQTVSAPYTVLAGTRTLTPLEPAMYVEEGATVAMRFDVAAQQNGAPAATPIAWTARGSIALGQPATQTDSTGSSSESVSVGPLAAGVVATVSACAWATICAPFSATGVAASSIQIGVWSGSGQSVSGGTPFAPLILQITDSAGHSVAGASVTIGQTVTEMVLCPAQGRCPAAPVLASEVTAVTSDLNGQVTVLPISVPGVASQTAIQCSSGMFGSATTVLTSSP